MKCEQELCRNWTGEGCACAVLGVEPEIADTSPVWVQGHLHAEPVCAWPDCGTYLTPAQMAARR